MSSPPFSPASHLHTPTMPPPPLPALTLTTATADSPIVPFNSTAPESCFPPPTTPLQSSAQLPETLTRVEATSSPSTSAAPKVEVSPSPTRRKISRPQCRSVLSSSSSTTTTTMSGSSPARQSEQRVERITSPSHILQALQLTWFHQRRSLFTSWVHVPLGITFLLFLVWAIKQAMDRAPFRFPSPVIAMLVLFFLLLGLDACSSYSLFAKKSPSSASYASANRNINSNRNINDNPDYRPTTTNKRRLQPVLKLLEPPCDFCLRYMSVMFTPSFILIPARELISAKEIGIITAWFAVTQILALLFPVYLHKLFRLIGDKSCFRGRKRHSTPSEMGEIESGAVEHEKPTFSDRARYQRQEMFSQHARGVGSGTNFGNTITRLSGASTVAPTDTLAGIDRRPGLSLCTEARDGQEEKQQQQPEDEDVRRQMTHVQMETARQQGDPYMTSPQLLFHHTSSFGSPDPQFAGKSGRDRGLSKEKGSPSSPIFQEYEGFRPHHFFSHRQFYSHDADLPRRSRSVNRNVARREGSSSTRSKSTSNTVDCITGPHRCSGSRLRKQFKPVRARSASPLSYGRSETFQSAGLNIEPNSSNRQMVISSLDSDRYSHENQRIIGQQDVECTPPDSTTCPATRVASPHPSQEAFAKNGDTASSEDLEIQVLQSPNNVTLPTVNFDGLVAGDRRPSKADSQKTLMHAATENQTAKEKIIVVDDSDSDLEAQQQPRSCRVDHSNGHLDRQQQEEQEDDAPDAVERLSERFADAITPAMYLILLVVGIPLFYLLDLSLPLFLAINLVTFLASISIVPPKIRRYAHPILTTSVATLLILWGLGAIRGWTLKQTLNSYSVDAKYSVLWSISPTYKGPVVGAGDILFSTLDAGIVSLAIPMYRYRRDLWTYLPSMLGILFPCSLLSLFVWPCVAHLVGVAPERALSFASRFMSTPLAIELSLTIGADESITVILVVITGILISVFKDPFFKLVRVDQNDHLTIGIAMGSTAGAIGASSLIAKPKTMAIASLSFVLFGTILLIFAAIPPVVLLLRHLAGADIHLL